MGVREGNTEREREAESWGEVSLHTLLPGGDRGKGRNNPYLDW